jgi:hypothetical protein
MPKTRKKPSMKRLPKQNFSKHEKNTKLIDLVRKYKIIDLNNEDLLRVVEIETGKELTMDQLTPLIEQAKREIQEAEIIVNTHMDYMIRVGMYESSIREDKMLEFIEKLIFGMILKEHRRPDEDKNENLILNATEKFLKVVATKSNIITNIGYLSKAKEMLENRDENEGKTTILIQNDKNEDLQSQILELDDNEVA